MRHLEARHPQHSTSGDVGPVLRKILLPRKKLVPGRAKEVAGQRAEGDREGLHVDQNFQIFVETLFRSVSTLLRHLQGDNFVGCLARTKIGKCRIIVCCDP